MVVIGDDITPGPVTEVKSANFVGVQPSAPRDGALVGPADLGTNAGQGSATAETVYSVHSNQQAESLFGNSSMLTRQIRLCLAQGANPVYAVAPSGTAVSSESLGTSTSGTLANAPISEKAADVTFSVDGTTQTTVYSFTAASDSPASGDVHVNPNTGEYTLGTSPGTSSSADYVYFDYQNALDAVSTNVGGIIDFLGVLQENGTQTDNAVSTVNSMQSQYDFAITLFGIGGQVDTTSYTSSTDDSRAQAYYPTRDHQGNSIIGAIIGKRASIGLSSSPMMTSLSGPGRMLDRLNEGDMQNLIEQNVNPIASRTTGARIIDDLTTVTDSNSSEAQFDTGFVRLAMDTVILLVKENEEPFIGMLNTKNTRNALEGSINTQMKNLKRSQVVEEYKVKAREIDARSVELEVNVDTVKGLRNIYNTITAGIPQPEENKLEVEDGSKSTTEASDGSGGSN